MQGQSGVMLVQALLTPRGVHNESQNLERISKSRESQNLVYIKSPGTHPHSHTLALVVVYCNVHVHNNPVITLESRHVDCTVLLV